MSGLFVTATDTGAGKTLVAAALLHAARAHDLRAVGMKPVASGCDQTPRGLRNDDALRLLAASTPGFDYADINPYAFAEPVAPHLAARDAGVRLDAAFLIKKYQYLESRADLVVVEGAGGWRVPLGEDYDFADLSVRAGWPVVLVVAMRLGCINHALLSVESIRRRARLAGWVANCLPPRQPRLEDNLDSLRARIDAPLLGVVPPLTRPAPETVAAMLSLDPLLTPL